MALKGPDVPACSSFVVVLFQHEACTSLCYPGFCYTNLCVLLVACCYRFGINNWRLQLLLLVLSVNDQLGLSY